jgi:hypothetical protein
MIRSCVLAALSSNMDLTLWTAATNNLKEEWIKVCSLDSAILDIDLGSPFQIHDVTPFLLDTYSQEGDQSMTAQALQAQVISEFFIFMKHQCH